MGLQNLLSKARNLARGREDKIGRGLDKAEQTISERTGGKYDEKLRSAREKVDENLTGQSEQPAAESPRSDEPAAESPRSDEPGTESPRSDEAGTEAPRSDESGNEPPRRGDSDTR